MNLITRLRICREELFELLKLLWCGGCRAGIEILESYTEFAGSCQNE
jgi:hypothetical protein